MLLCHVANAIDPAAVDMKKVNQRPQMAQFLCLKNIRRVDCSLSKVLGSDRGPGLDARTETAVLGSLKTVVLGKHLDKL